MYSQHEYCLLCSSLNKLLINKTDHAWECWNCNSRYWLDDQARIEYMAHFSLSYDIAEEDLHSNVDVVKGIPRQPYAIKRRSKNINFCMIENND